MSSKYNKYTIQNLATPSYIFDLDILRERVAFLRSLLGSNIHICYAMKANPFLVSAISPMIDRFEVCSPGEFQICKKEDISFSKIVVSGVYKNDSDIENMMSLHNDIGIYTAESIEQFELLNKASQICGSKIRVLLRLTSGNQFGMDEEDIKKIVAKRNDYKNIKIIGIQYFSGTQKSSLKRLEKEINYVNSFMAMLQDSYGFVSEEFEFGPGFPVEYFSGENEFDEKTFISSFASLLSTISFKGNITLELGRSIAASCGFYLTKAVDLKTNKSQNYCIVDGGIHQICYYGQVMAMKKPFCCHINEDKGQPEVSWNICGALCTVNDILVKQLPLHGLKKGDIIVFENAGAYSMIEGMSLFLSRDLPTIYLYSQNEGMICVRSEKPTYLLNTPE